MIAKETVSSKLEDVLKTMIDDWYVHIEEYPELHKYLAASLAKVGFREMKDTAEKAA